MSEKKMDWTETQWGKKYMREKHMSEKNIVVPEGMLEAAMGTCFKPRSMGSTHLFASGMLEAALRWLSENPIVPTDEQVDAVAQACGYTGLTDYPLYRASAAEWQRRMFLAPEPKLLSDLLYTMNPGCDAKTVNERIIEAYMLGRKAGQ